MNLLTVSPAPKNVLVGKTGHGLSLSKLWYFCCVCFCIDWSIYVTTCLLWCNPSFNERLFFHSASRARMSFALLICEIEWQFLFFTFQQLKFEKEMCTAFKAVRCASKLAHSINPLNTKRRLLYLKSQFVPRSKHFSSRL